MKDFGRRRESKWNGSGQEVKEEGLWEDKEGGKWVASYSSPETKLCFAPVRDTAAAIPPPYLPLSSVGDCEPLRSHPILVYTRGFAVFLYLYALIVFLCYLCNFFVPSVLWYCCSGLLTCKTVSQITYTVLLETLNQPRLLGKTVASGVTYF